MEEAAGENLFGMLRNRVTRSVDVAGLIDALDLLPIVGTYRSAHTKAKGESLFDYRLDLDKHVCICSQYGDQWDGTRQEAERHCRISIQNQVAKYHGLLPLPVTAKDALTTVAILTARMIPRIAIAATIVGAADIGADLYIASTKFNAITETGRMAENFCNCSYILENSLPEWWRKQ